MDTQIGRLNTGQRPAPSRKVPAGRKIHPYPGIIIRVTLDEMCLITMTGTLQAAVTDYCEFKHNAEEGNVLLTDDGYKSAGWITFEPTLTYLEWRLGGLDVTMHTAADIAKHHTSVGS